MLYIRPVIEPKELRLANVIINADEKIVELDEDRIEILMAVRDWSLIKPLPLTKKILKENLGFNVHDMGDYWQAERGHFVMIQVKFGDVEMPWSFGYKTMVPKTINIKFVHQLQNIYSVIEQKELVWQK